jgi:hypothetical protein
VHPNLTMLTNVSCVLPNLDAPNATTAPQPALSLRLNATLSSGADGAVLATNSWRARLFPNLLPEASPTNRTVYAPHRYENGLFEPFIYKNDDFTKTGSGQT